MKITNFKDVGTWWNDRDVELVEIDNEVYALHGYNGEVYQKCWKCGGEYNMDILEDGKEYRITPHFEEDKDGDFVIVAYSVQPA